MYDYLDITVIDIRQRNIPLKLSQDSNITYEISAHQYNPFINEYKKEAFSEYFEIFPDKMRNMHGYGLNTSFYILHPFVYDSRGTDNIDFYSNYLRGVNFFISKTVADTLNFSITFKVINNISEVRRNFVENKIDFTITPFIIIKPRSNKRNYDFAVLILSIANYLIIKQKVRYQIVIGLNLIEIVGIFIGIVTIFLLFLNILNVKLKIWTVYHIVSITIGNTLPFDFRSIQDKILFL